jgi:hypothetical protein
MAKSGSAVGSKETFGTRKKGKSKRKYGPKEEKPKAYRGQGKK